MAGAADRKIQPIVIKRVKKVVHGHHGGAWKIAYADFVTAMMAFFLLMWLLGSTATGDLRGISDYFNTPLKVALEGGSGSGDSSSIIKGGGQDFTRTAGHVRRGEVTEKKDTINLQALRAEFSHKERAKLTRLKERMEEVIARTPGLLALKDQIRLELIADGLSIQIVDAKNRPMFSSGSSVVQAYMRELLRAIGGLLNEVENPVSLTGHTDAAPYAGGNRGYSNWELSAERANASRRELIAGGMNPEKVLRVMGVGPVVPLDKTQPLDPMNRRIAIVVLNQAARQRILRGSEFDVEEAADLTKALAARAAEGKTPLERVLGVDDPESKGTEPSPGAPTSAGEEGAPAGEPTRDPAPAIEPAQPVSEAPTVAPAVPSTSVATGTPVIAPVTPAAPDHLPVAIAPTGESILR